MSSTRLSRVVLGAVILGLLTAPTLVAVGADARTVTAARRTSAAPNVAFPVASSKAQDLRLYGGRPGTEIQAPCGSIVRAAHPGTAHLGASTTSGKHLVWVVTSKDKLTSYYGYMDSSLVKEGQILQSGQRIGTVGKQGIARFCALYFAINRGDGTRINPSAWLDKYVGQPAPVSSLFGNSGFVIASFNTLGASHTKKKGRYPDYAWRTPRQVTMLKSYKVDVVGLQEFQKQQRKLFLQTAGTGYGIYPTDIKADSENSIIWRNSTMEFVSGSTIDVPYFDGHKRKMPVVLLRQKSTGRTAYVINVHNPASIKKYGNQTKWRKAAIAVERATIVELRKTGRPVFLTGDLNDRNAAYCPFAKGKLMISANTVPSMTCAPPDKPQIDWVLAAGPARFSRYAADWAPKDKKLTDHPIIVTRTHLAE